MNLNDLYTQYINGLTSHLSNEYGVVVVRDAQLSDTFPIVELKPLTKAYLSETLSYTERQDRISFQIDIFAKDKQYHDNKYYADEIVLTLADMIDEYFSTNGYRIVFNNHMENLDVDIKRRTIRVEAIYDYKSNMVYKT